MNNSLDHLTIRGFKSIRALEDSPLGNLNIFIGGNGAGKSNLLEFFRLRRGERRQIGNNVIICIFQ